MTARRFEVSEPEDNRSELADVVDRNIRTLLERKRREDRAMRAEEKIADRVTRFTGSMRFVWVHVGIYGAWILINLGVLGLPRFDPTFVLLAMVASVEAIFLSTFILIAQNRMSAQADRRADLDLQISLLSEHEITRLIQLVADIADRMGIESSQNPELQELKQDVSPEAVLEKIEEHEADRPDGGDALGTGDTGTDPDPHSRAW